MKGFILEFMVSPLHLIQMGKCVLCISIRRRDRPSLLYDPGGERVHFKPLFVCLRDALSILQYGNCVKMITVIQQSGACGGLIVM